MFKLKKKTNRKVTKARKPLYRMSRSLLDWLKLMSCVSVFLLIVGGTYHFFSQTTYFRLKQIVIHGSLKHLTQDQVLKLAQIPKKTNLFSLNIYEIGQNLKKHPWIHEVSVRRNFPDTLILEVEEHVPAAVLTTYSLDAETGKVVREFYYVVSDAGVIFLRIPSKEIAQKIDLPRMKGFDQDRMEKYPAYYQDKFKEAFGFVTQFQKHTANEEFAMQDLNYDVTDGVTVIAQRTLGCETQSCDPLILYFGKDQYEEKLNQWAELVRLMKDEGRTFKKVDLHVLGKVFAKS